MGTKDLAEKNVRSFENDARLALHDFTLPQYVALFFNTERPMLGDEKLRLGLQLAINKETVITAHGGRVKVIDTPLLEIASADWKYEFDAARADGALFDAGWQYRDSGATGAIVETPASEEAPSSDSEPGTNDFPLFITLPTDAPHLATAETDFYVEGTAPTGSVKVIVNGYQLQKFQAGSSDWSYKASLALGTLKAGENEYVVENQAGEFDRLKIFYSADESEQAIWLAEQEQNLATKTIGLSEEILMESESADNQTAELRLRYKDGEPLALKLLIPDYRAEFLPVAEEIVRQWRERGVKLTIERLPEAEFLLRLSKRDYDIVLFGQNLGYNLDTYSFWHSSEARENGSNLSNLKSSAVNAWLEQIRSSFDSSERRKRLANLREVLSEEVPGVMLYTPTYSYVVDRKVQGFNLGRIALRRDRLANLATWYLRESRQATSELSIWNFMQWLYRGGF